jgi:two-component system CheB/CheR fusion protein
MNQEISGMSVTSENNDPVGQQQEHDFLVVGLGASAGGIKAFKEFFAHVPPASGMAYVVILHLSPEHESHLAEVLQDATEMPVKQVCDADKIEPNHVYVIPPNRSLAINDGHLALSEIKRLRGAFGHGRRWLDGSQAHQGDGRHLSRPGA